MLPHPLYKSINYSIKPELSPKMKAKRPEILCQIREKGGLYALGAELYGESETKGSFFIAECFEQCHVPEAAAHWGPDLVMEIVHYRLEMIRYPLWLIEDRLNRTSCASF